MNWKLIFLFFVTALSLNISAQNSNDTTAIVTGIVRDTTSEPLPGVRIYLQNMESHYTLTNKKGEYVLIVPQHKKITIVFSYPGFEEFTKTLRLREDEGYLLNVKLAGNYNLSQTVVEEKRFKPSTEKINLIDFEQIPTTTGGVEGILRYLGASTTSELSSQYSVRGGNYDENLVYLNDFEIYRPLLARTGRQEGLSILNSDLISSLQFSSGGFESKYGDKMSSVLDVKYKKPKKYETNVRMSLLGASFATEGLVANKKLSYLIGGRYMTNQYLLRGLQTKGEYKPVFYDAQSYITYDLTDRLEVAALGYFSDNQYHMIPQTRQTKFGTVQEVKSFTVFFEGQELTRFQTSMGGLAFSYTNASNTLKLKWLSSVFLTKQDETQDVLGEYWLNAVETDFGKEDFGQEAYNLGVGRFHNWLRNYMDILVANTALRASFETGQHFLQWGLKGQVESVRDHLNEWLKLDSAEYTLPFSEEKVLLSDVLKTNIALTSRRYTGYIQDTWKKTTKDTSGIYLNAGLRFNYWDFSEEWLFSPRAQFSYEPNWKNQTIFKIASGVYYQPPFYRELRDFRGKINRKIEAQRSVHLVLGGDYNFEVWKRKFKFTSELFYKKLDNLNPYKVDNIRIRYFADNISCGYAAGVDLRLYGELVKDAESWISLTLMQTQEDLENDFYIDNEGNRAEPGYIPRPTDQRVNFGMFFQDYLPGNKNFKMNLSFLYGTGLPFGPPSLDRYKDILRNTAYRRVDVGFSGLLVDETKEKYNQGFFKHFQSLWVSLEVFNLLGVSNVVSHLWIRDNDERLYAIPNFLTPRRINLKLHAKL